MRFNAFAVEVISRSATIRGDWLTNLQAEAPEASGKGGITVMEGGITSAYTTTGNPLIALGGFAGSSYVSGYLNYILFDENYVPIKAKSFPVQNLPSTKHTVQFDQPLEIKELGYLFVYVSYDNNNSNLYLYYDDLKVVVEESPLIQVNSYYPFGMLVRRSLDEGGVSGTWLREGEIQNANLFQGKELISQTGCLPAEALAEAGHDFGSRMYWADLGRWFSIDPQKQFSSPYVGMGNMPAMGRDPDGEFVQFIIGALIGGMLNTVVQGVSGNVLDMGQFLTAFGVGALSGAAGVGAGIFVAKTAGTVGFFAGAQIGAAGGFAGGFVGGAGNAWTHGASLTEGLHAGLVGGGAGALTGGLIGGISGGISSIKHGGDFWTGEKATFDLLATDPLPQEGEAVNYSNQSAKEFSDTYIDKNIKGLKKLYADGTTAKTHNRYGDKVFNKQGEEVLGGTEYQGRGQSNVYLYKGAFSSKEQLYTAMVHEYIHVGHFNASLFSKSASEHSALSWYNAQAARFGLPITTSKYLSPQFYFAEYDYRKFAPPIISVLPR